MFHGGSRRGSAVFDYVIIGAGPAGCACARALLEGTEEEPHSGDGVNRSVTIALLEEAPCLLPPLSCRTAAGYQVLS